MNSRFQIVLHRLAVLLLLYLLLRKFIFIGQALDLLFQILPLFDQRRDLYPKLLDLRLLLGRGNLQVHGRVFLALQFILRRLRHLLSVLVVRLFFHGRVLIFCVAQFSLQIRDIALQLLVVGVQLLVLRDYISRGLFHPFYFRSQRHYLLLLG